HWRPIDVQKSLRHWLLAECLDELSRPHSCRDHGVDEVSGQRQTPDRCRPDLPTCRGRRCSSRHRGTPDDRQSDSAGVTSESLTLHYQCYASTISPARVALRPGSTCTLGVCFA